MNAFIDSFGRFCQPIDVNSSIKIRLTVLYLKAYPQYPERHLNMAAARLDLLNMAKVSASACLSDPHDLRTDGMFLLL